MVFLQQEATHYNLRFYKVLFFPSRARHGEASSIAKCTFSMCTFSMQTAVEVIVFFWRFWFGFFMHLSHAAALC